MAQPGLVTHPQFEQNEDRTKAGRKKIEEKQEQRRKRKETQEEKKISAGGIPNSKEVFFKVDINYDPFFAFAVVIFHAT